MCAFAATRRNRSNTYRPLHPAPGHRPQGRVPDADSGECVLGGGGAQGAVQWTCDNPAVHHVAVDDSLERMGAHGVEQVNGLALCAGVGGLELGLKLAIGDNYRTVGYVEREAYAAAVIVARMDDEAMDRAPIWDDISTFDGRPWRGVVDLISAGYPCQPFSVAGKRQGTNDPRHLWPHVARIIRECEPIQVFLENVGGHLSIGFREVAEELRGMGYEVAAGLFTAKEVGLLHNRERLFALAASNAICGGWQWERETTKEQRAWKQFARLVQAEERISVPSGKSGGNVDGSNNRVDRLCALGNGVVPIVAAYAYRTLAEALCE